jgi:hypothetical protein
MKIILLLKNYLITIIQKLLDFIKKKKFLDEKFVIKNLIEKNEIFGKACLIYKKKISKILNHYLKKFMNYSEYQILSEILILNF